MTQVEVHFFYQNNETGELFTYKEMRADFAERYDGNDDTSCIDWQEHYSKMFHDGKCWHSV